MYGFESIILFMLFILLVVYFVPAIVAFARRATDAGFIFLVNLLLGWTFLGWIGVLVWACINPSVTDQNKIRSARPESTSDVPQHIEPISITESTIYDELQKLKSLHDKGVISDVEFEVAKAKQLSKI